MKGIYAQESSNGTNDSCKQKGLVNGFGFGQSTYSWLCFGSFADVASRVDNWLDDHLKYMTIKQSLCYYNKGEVLNDCDYAESVLGFVQ